MKRRVHRKICEACFFDGQNADEIAEFLSEYRVLAKSHEDKRYLIVQDQDGDWLVQAGVWVLKEIETDRIDTICSQDEMEAFYQDAK